MTLFTVDSKAKAEIKSSIVNKTTYLRNARKTADIILFASLGFCVVYCVLNSIFPEINTSIIYGLKVKLWSSIATHCLAVMTVSLYAYAILLFTLHYLSGRHLAYRSDEKLASDGSVLLYAYSSPPVSEKPCRWEIFLPETDLQYIEDKRCLIFRGNIRRVGKPSNKKSPKHLATKEKTFIIYDYFSPGLYFNIKHSCRSSVRLHSDKELKLASLTTLIPNSPIEILTLTIPAAIALVAVCFAVKMLAFV